jgi:hypothetical protein
MLMKTDHQGRYAVIHSITITLSLSRNRQLWITIKYSKLKPCSMIIASLNIDHFSYPLPLQFIYEPLRVLA